MPAQEMDVNSDQDLSKGYCIKVEVYPDGFTVSDPLPLDDSSEEYAEGSEDNPQEEAEEKIPDLTSMLKNVMQVVKENPVGQGEEQAFDETASQSA